MRGLATVALLLAACGVNTRTGDQWDVDLFGVRDLAPAFDLGGQPGRDGAVNVQPGCGELQGCYTVYAHNDNVLYRLDLPNRLIVQIGPFSAPMINGREDAITDLAVAPNDTIYAISKSNLYTVDPNTGKVKLVSAVPACGGYAVALTFTPDGNLYAGDHTGAFCRIDVNQQPPQVISLGDIGQGYALSGDLVAVGDGTMYATVFKPADQTTTSNNWLATIDPATGRITNVIGQSGYPRLFGTAYDQAQVFAFTGDGSGDVVTIDPKTGKGTLYGSFKDPSTGKGISFAGAAVNARVDPIIQ